MKKASFVKIIDAMMDFWDKAQLLENILGVGFRYEDNFLTRVVDTITDALCDEMESGCPSVWDPLIFDYAYNCNWGRDRPVKAVIDGKEYLAANASELYDLIILMKPIYREENI